MSNQILENMKTRRSVRAYTTEPVAEADLQTVIDAALWAPSAMSRQTWQFTVIRNREKIAELAAVVAKQLGKSPDVYNFYKPAVFIVTSNKADNKNGFADCSCAMQNMMLAAHSIGLASVWINQLIDLTDNAEVRAILGEFGVPADHKLAACLSLGHAAQALPAGTERLGTVKFVD